MRSRASRAGRLANFNVSEEKAAHKLAKEFSKILGTYIDPYTLRFFPAIGYWAHNHQDVQRFTGHFPRPDLPKFSYGFGSWSLTISKISKGCKFKIEDHRNGDLAENDFQIEE